MEPLEGPVIRPLKDVIREHVEAVLEAYGGQVPEHRLALELGISPSTLVRYRKRWKVGSGETLMGDRR
jgi:DNA-binding NtrC family response regulator